MTFAEKLQKWRGVTGRGRKARGKIPQAQAATMLGVNLRTYQDWESGRHEPVGFALSQIEALLWRKNAGRPVASSNRKTKGTPSGKGTGKAKSNHDSKKRKK
jgi:hypothetical protein